MTLVRHLQTDVYHILKGESVSFDTTQVQFRHQNGQSSLRCIEGLSMSCRVTVSMSSITLYL